MGLAVHPNVTLRKMDHLGEDHDAIVKMWVEEMCRAMDCKYIGHEQLCIYNVIFYVIYFFSLITLCVHSIFTIYWRQLRHQPKGEQSDIVKSWQDSPLVQLVRSEKQSEWKSPPG